MALARKHGVPVRWNEDRSENTMATIHGRGQVQKIELAADADGKLTAIRVRLLADMGAYLQLVTPGIPLLGAFLYAGVYDLPKAYDFSCTSVFTTMTPTDAYRGAGRPEATYAIERAMDSLAAKIGVDPLELRRRNFIATDKYPYEAYSGLVYDSGNHDGAATKAAEMLGYDELRARQATQNVDGSTKRLGIGVTSYFEMCGLAPSRVLASLNYSAGGWEAATVRVLPTSKVQVVTGSAPHGQGHETAWSMIVAEKMGISPDDVDVLHSDTAIAPLGLDTYGSRSLAVGGVAIAMACDKVIDKAKQIAAHQLEASADDLEYAGGAFSVQGLTRQDDAAGGDRLRGVHRPQPPRRAGAQPRSAGHLRPAELLVAVRHPHVRRRGRHRDRPRRGVEVRRRRRLRRAGQPDDRRRSGARRVVQGIGQALWEEAVYDTDGNLKTSTLAEYLVPAASDVPSITTGHTVTPSPTNQLGVKGIGEAGTIGAALDDHQCRRRRTVRDWACTTCRCPPARTTSGPQSTQLAPIAMEARSDPCRIRLRPCRIGRGGDQPRRSARRGCQVPRRRPQPAAAHEAAPRAAERAHRHRADQRPVVHP